MAYDSNRRALRAGLPWIMAGFLLLVASIGLWEIQSATLFGELGGALHLALLATLSGALGSGVFLVGAIQLARARIAGRYSFWLVLCFALWLGEFVLRLTSLASDAPSPSLLAARLILAGASMFALSSGMLWIWDRSEPAQELATWRWTRAAFALQVAAYLFAPLASLWLGEPLSERLAQYHARLTFVNVLSWLVFALPFAHLLLSLRRSARRVSRRETLAEILTS